MATLTHTFTRTHITFTPANPFLACAVCGKRAEAFHDDACGCDPENYPDFSQPINFPCMHASADYDDLCPSWSPVDGCTCLAVLGSVPHPAVLPRA